jgi:hypothetical protein
MDSMIDPSIEEKIAKYNQINGIDTSQLNSGYINYIPTPSDNSSKQDNNPKIDFSSMAQNSSMLSPLLSTNSNMSTPTKTTDKAVIPIDNTKVSAITTPKETPKVAPVNSKVFNPNQAAKDAYSYYVNGKGLAPHIAAGIVGNLYQESGVDPTRHQNDGGVGRGIAQWTEGDRWKAFQNWSQHHGRDPLNLHTQLDYILLEPGQEGALKKTMATKNASDAALTFGKYFEGPAEKTARWDVRQGIANSLYNSKV